MCLSFETPHIDNVFVLSKLAMERTNSPRHQPTRDFHSSPPAGNLLHDKAFLLHIIRLNTQLECVIFKTHLIIHLCLCFCMCKVICTELFYSYFCFLSPIWCVQMVFLKGLSLIFYLFLRLSRNISLFSFFCSHPFLICLSVFVWIFIFFCTMSLC